MAGATVGSICVEPPTTKKDADESRLTTVPLTVTLPPGVSVCPGSMKNCVAAFPVMVDDPIVNTGGGGDCDPGASTCGRTDVFPPTTTAVPEGTSDTGTPPTVMAGPPG